MISQHRFASEFFHYELTIACLKRGAGFGNYISNSGCHLYLSFCSVWYFSPKNKDATQQHRPCLQKSHVGFLFYFVLRVLPSIHLKTRILILKSLAWNFVITFLNGILPLRSRSLSHSVSTVISKRVNVTNRKKAQLRDSPRFFH